MTRKRLIYALAALWGVAEATVFFIVPDVLLSRVALRDRRSALVACLWASVGAVSGGILIWFLGNQNPDAVRSLFVALPAIDSAMVANVRAQMTNLGAAAVFIGPATGTPYKIYALEAAGAGLGILPFVLISIPARLARFVLVSLLAAAASRVLLKRLSLNTVYALHAATWIGFYAAYFSLMSGT